MNIEMSVIIGLSAIYLITIIILIKNKFYRGADYFQTDLANMRQEINQLNGNINQTLDNHLVQANQSIQQQLQQSIAIVNNVSQRLVRLDETNRRVVDVADKLKTLRNVLQNLKQRGVFGELYLNSVLDNILAPNQWQAQYRFNDGQIVDAVIFLDKKRILPIDSKFSLENYNRYIETTDKSARAKLLDVVKADLKNRIDETAKYIKPNENTMEFAFMFIPIVNENG